MGGRAGERASERATGRPGPGARAGMHAGGSVHAQGARRSRVVVPWGRYGRAGCTATVLVLCGHAKGHTGTFNSNAR